MGLGAIEVFGLEQGCHHHQVLRDALGILLAQGSQLLVHGTIELLACHALGDPRLGKLRLLGCQPRTATPLAVVKRACTTLAVPS
jgi:hypothetical protein